MIISQKTIEKLRELINEETEYRSGSKLVAFFNQYGFRDVYVEDNFGQTEKLSFEFNSQKDEEKEKTNGDKK